jgi:hypothetical protein
MLLGCLPPNSPRLKRFFFCLSYVIIGYVARCAAERLGGSGGSQHAGGPRWAPAGDWAAAALHLHHNGHGAHAQ